MFIKKIHLCLLMFMVVTIFISLLSNPVREGATSDRVNITHVTNNDHRYFDNDGTTHIITNRIGTTNVDIPENTHFFTIPITADSNTITYTYKIYDTIQKLQIESESTNKHPLFKRKDDATSIKILSRQITDVGVYDSTTNSFDLKVTRTRTEGSHETTSVASIQIHLDRSGSRKPTCPEGCNLSRVLNSASQVNPSSIWENQVGTFKFTNKIKCTTCITADGGKPEKCNAAYANRSDFQNSCQTEKHCQTCAETEFTGSGVDIDDLQYKDPSKKDDYVYAKSYTSPGKKNGFWSKVKLKVSNFSGANGITDWNTFNQAFERENTNSLNNQALQTWASGHGTAIEAGDRLRGLATSSEGSLEPEGNTASSLSSAMVKFSKMLKDHESHFHRTVLRGDNAPYTGFSY